MTRNKWREKRKKKVSTLAGCRNRWKQMEGRRWTRGNKYLSILIINQNITFTHHTCKIPICRDGSEQASDRVSKTMCVWHFVLDDWGFKHWLARGSCLEHENFTHINNLEPQVVLHVYKIQQRSYWKEPQAIHSCLVVTVLLPTRSWRFFFYFSSVQSIIIIEEPKFSCFCFSQMCTHKFCLVIQFLKLGRRNIYSQ